MNLILGLTLKRSARLSDPLLARHAARYWNLSLHAADYARTLARMLELIAAVYQLGGGVYSREILAMNLAGQLSRLRPSEGLEKIASSKTARLLKLGLPELSRLRKVDQEALAREEAERLVAETAESGPEVAPIAPASGGDGEEKPL
ncbi:hypothetical protein WR25_22716 [Diploscapter pachys]|uniref:Uncharacterized protein n=1 Tax=Diploscapter pachys TaxID=2018661 RepID=A0A2A2KIM0_9BILA|nr:hypothetical protein WR25_22716 [Diploscapter pachys]